MDESVKCLYAVALGLIQGVGEFLPISSSAHLLLLSKLTHAEYFGKAFDVALHGATLMALLIYKRELFLRTLSALRNYFLRAGAEIRSRRLPKAGDRFEALGLAALICTLPTALLGFLLEYRVERYFHSLVWIAAFLSLFAAVMYAADKSGKNVELTALGPGNFLKLGFMQALALFPGVSRSGAVLAGARFMNLDRGEAYVLSLVTAVPVVGGAFAVKLMKGLEAAPSDWQYIFLGGCAAFVSGLCFIRLAEGLVSRFGLTPFVIYRCLMSLALSAL